MPLGPRPLWGGRGSTHAYQSYHAISGPQAAHPECPLTSLLKKGVFPRVLSHGFPLVESQGEKREGK